MTVEHVCTGIAVADYAAALPWYRDFFGRPPDFVVTETEGMWQLADKALLYVVADPERAGNALVTILVADLAEVVTRLRGRGVDTGAVERVPEAWKIVLTDPDGNRITVAEIPSSDTAEVAAPDA